LQDLRAPTKETGFFTESAGDNEVFRKKPGFWAPCVRLNLIIDKEQFSFILAIIIGLVPQAIALTTKSAIALHHPTSICG